MIVILPVFNSDDIAALPEAATALQILGVSRLWIIHNPDIGVRDGAALEQFDTDIGKLESAMKAAADRLDFEAAKQYKSQLESRILDRDVARRDGWKKTPQHYLEKAYNEALAPVLGKQVCPLTGATALLEAHEPEQIFEILRGLLPSWPRHIPHGKHAILWPRSLKALSKTEPAPGPTPVRVVSGPSPTPVPSAPEQPKSRREILRAKKWIGARKIALDYGLNIEGVKNLDAMVDLIIAHESKQQVAA